MRHGIVEGEPNVIPSPLRFVQRLARKRQEAGPWSRVGAYAICRDADGRILLARLSSQLPADAGSWAIPGGKVEWGEHPHDTVLRELEEETGLFGSVERLRDAWSHVIPAETAVTGDPGHILGFVYDVSVVGGDLRAEPDGTTDQARWFTLDEARDLPRVPLVDFCLGLCD